MWRVPVKSGVQLIAMSFDRFKICIIVKLWYLIGSNPHLNEIESFLLVEICIILKGVLNMPILTIIKVLKAMA